MRTIGSTTLDSQRQRLEQEIIVAKKKIILMEDSVHPDINTINQLRDKIERNMQLITMIERHRPAKVTGFRVKVI